MACPNFENRILDYLDKDLPAAERETVERHLVACPECRAFASQWNQLDAALAHFLTPPVLSPGFSARLWARIDVQAAGVAKTEPALRKAECEAEFLAYTAWLQRRCLNWAGLLDGIGLAILLTLGAYGLYGLSSGVAEAPATALAGSQGALALLLIGGAGMLAGVVLALKPRAVRLAAPI
jgi:anti-sigma factor RsiW